MEIADLFPFLQTLEDDLDKLEEAVAPLIYGTLAKAVFKLPVLDKAQHYVVVAYAIETIIFCKLYTMHCFTSLLNVISISATQWRQRHGACGLRRNRAGQAILRED